MATQLASKSKRFTFGAFFAAFLMLNATPLSLAMPGSGSGNGSSDLPAAPTKTESGTAVSPSPEAIELEQLKASVEAQTKQFAEHSQELDSERTALREELAAIEKLEAKLGVPDSNSGAPSLAAVQPPIGGTSAVNGQQNDQGRQPTNIVTVPNPVSIRIGGADFTPGGFVDLTGIFRSTK